MRFNRTIPIEIVKQRLFQKWGDLVKIDESSYTKMVDSARFIHQEYGEFWSKPYHYINNNKTSFPSRCNNTRSAKSINEELISQGRNDIILNESTYINTKQKAEFIDKDYGSWMASPSIVLSQKTKHPKRARLSNINNQRFTETKIKEMLLIAHGTQVTLKSNTYNGMQRKCIFIDEKFGEWSAYPDLVIRQKTSHPSRTIGTSKKELEVLKFVQNYYKDATKKFFGSCQKQKKKIGYSIDVYIPSLNLGIEFDGTLFHSVEWMVKSKKNWTLDEILTYHEDKDQFLLDNFNIKVLHIKEADWNLNKKLCFEQIKSFLGVINDS